MRPGSVDVEGQGNLQFDEKIFLSVGPFLKSETDAAEKSGKGRGKQYLGNGRHPRGRGGSVKRIPIGNKHIKTRGGVVGTVRSYTTLLVWGTPPHEEPFKRESGGTGRTAGKRLEGRQDDTTEKKSWTEGGN